MPPLNAEALKYFGPDDGKLLWDTDALIRLFANGEGIPGSPKAAFLVGGQFAADFRDPPGHVAEGRPGDNRNSAYYYPRGGGPGTLRYDKVHLVPFGEYIPFQESFPWLYHLLISLGPPNMEDYQLTRGDESRLTVFPLADRAGHTWRFVTPICFEDIDASLVARMFRPEATGPGAGLKRADFIVNITNDGWFRSNENPQHLQAATFRSIENRAPTARSVNTGISGFIDSMGRTGGLVAAGTEGTTVAAPRIDSRLTLFTRYGNLFALACSAAAAGMAAGAVVRRWTKRRRGTAR